MTDGPRAGVTQPLMIPGETALAEKADRYRSPFAYIPNGVFSLDPEGRLTEANEALQELIGRSRDEMLDTDYHQLFHSEDIAAAEKAFSTVEERVPQTLEARPLPAVGEVHDIKMTAVPVVAFDQVVGVHASIEDIIEANSLCSPTGSAGVPHDATH